MTGVVEMSSIPQWKIGLSTVNGDFEDYRDVDKSRSRGQDMLDIPTWKREFVSNKNKNMLQECKKTCVFDSSSISTIIDTNSNDVKSLSEPSVTEKVQEKLNNVNPVKSEVSTNSLLSSNSDMGTNTNNSNGRKVKFDKDTVSSVETSHLKHVHSNPFFEQLGVDHPHGNIYNENGQDNMTNGVATDDDNEIQAEYAPNSGFVDKLRLKFAKLNSKQKTTYKSPRRFASLESLVDVGKSKNEVRSTFEKSGYTNQRLDRQKSSDSSINNVTRPKLRSAPKAPTHHPRITSATEPIKDSVIDSKNEQHVSSDFIKGRDDIVIIEQEIQQPSPTVSKSYNLPESGSIKSLKEGKQTADLPKPNTVINFRSLFEKKVSNTQQKNILPDSYVSKFMSNLPKGKLPLPPRPTIPPRRASQELVQTVSKIENEVVLKEKVEKTEDTDVSILKSKDSVDPSPSQSVKDLSMIFKQKPDRPFESPKSKRRSPEKKAIFDSSVITPVNEDYMVKEEKKVNSPRSTVTSPRSTTTSPRSTGKTSVPNKKPERMKKPQVSSSDMTEVINAEKNVTKSFNAVKLNTTEVKPSTESASLFPQRKQIFDSSNITENVVTPIAPPRIKGQKRNNLRKQAPSPTTEDAEKINFVKNTSISQPKIATSAEKDEHLINKNDKEKTKTSSPPSPTAQRMSVQEINERNKQKQFEAEKHLNKYSQNSVQMENRQTPNNITNENENKDNDDTPTRGVPSVIAAKRLNKADNNLNLGKRIIPLISANDKESDEEDDEPRLVKPSQFRSVKSTSPNVPKKDDNKSSDSLNFKNALKSSKNNQVSRTNIDDLIRGHKKPSAVFDSSNMVVVPKPATNGVPPLNLTDLVDDKPLDHPYQEGYIPTKIAPCNYVFEGAGVKLKTTPLMKRRKDATKGKITFHEDPKLHEYQSENAALKDYLEQNPHEVEEAKKEEEVLTLGGFLQDESSDDVDEPTTPREEETIKSNTPLSHTSGELTNYRSKYQTEDFQFGMSFNEPEPETKKEEAESLDNEDMDLCPADENSTINYTDSSISDMLF